MDLKPSLVSASGTDYAAKISPTISASGTEGYTALLVNPSETAVGTGNKYLLDLQLGGTTQFHVDHAGNVSFTGTLTGNGSGITSLPASAVSWATPGTIGSTTPNTGAFTTLSSTGYTQASGNFILGSGTGQFSQTYSGTGPAASITDSASASGNLLNLTTTSTVAGSNDKALNITVSGANSTAAVTRYGAFSNVTSTGVTSTNVGGSFSASGAANNYGLLVPAGRVGIGNTAPGAALDLQTSLSSTSGTDFGAKISPTITASGTEGYTALLVNSIESTVGSGNKFLLDLQTGGTSQFHVDNGGNLQTAGQIRIAQSFNAGSSTSINWNNGNVQYTTANCTSTAFTFTNMQDGGSYTLVVTGTTPTASCTFMQAAPAVSFKFVPANSQPTSTPAVYTFLSAGGQAYVSWVTGFI